MTTEFHLANHAHFRILRTRCTIKCLIVLGWQRSTPMILIDDVSMSIKESLPLLINSLNRYGLRERIKVFVAGKLVNPADVAWALCTGADFCNTARGFMFSLSCIQSLQCNKKHLPNRRCNS